MLETSSTPVNTPFLDQHEDQAHQQLQEKRQNISPIIVLLVGLLAGGVITTGVLFAFPNLNTSLFGNTAVNISTTDLPGSPVAESTISVVPEEILEDTQEYVSPHLKNFQFSYDSDVWSIEEGPIGETYQVRLKEVTGTGILSFSYIPPYGRGGAVWLIRPQNAFTSIVTSGDYSIARYKYESARGVTYMYGVQHLAQTQASNSTVVMFSKDPQSREGLITSSCSGAEGMSVVSEEDCVYLRNGEAIGYVNDPPFAWSITFEQKVPLQDVGITWVSDEYFQKSEIDVSKIITQVEYVGENPEKADEIVKQLTPTLFQQ